MKASLLIIVQAAVFAGAQRPPAQTHHGISETHHVIKDLRDTYSVTSKENEKEVLGDFISAFMTDIAPADADADQVLANCRQVGLSQAPKLTIQEIVPKKDAASTCLPTVQMHGMGDFAMNPAYRNLGRDVSKTLTGDSDGCYLLTPQLGKGVMEDIVGGFLRPLDASIDYFAEIVRNDSQIVSAGGFNAIGYSQGNLIIRGYIEKYNDPPVNHHLSMFGMGMGVAGFPDCPIEKYNVCRELATLLGAAAYVPAVQAHLMQANYYRDPTHMDQYRAGDVGLAQLNNEATNSDSSSALSLAGMTGNLTLVKGLKDIVVQPNDSEWYGYFVDGSQTEKATAQDSAWYSWFGLDSMDAKGQLGFETVDGNHMQFSNSELTAFVENYWM